MRQEDLAAVLGLKSAVQVSQWEGDKFIPNARRLDQLAQALDVTTGWLLNGNGKPPVNENVSRGTSGLPDRLVAAIDRFERDAVRMGASDREADYIRAILRAPDTLRLLLIADDGSALSTAHQEEELALLLDGFRLWVQRRIDRRSGDEGELPTRSGAPALKQHRQVSPTAALSRTVGKVGKKR
jgi:transcriptional regulator with XRE-family HTH domain